MSSPRTTRSNLEDTPVSFGRGISSEMSRATLGRYELVGEIGRGGYGIVFRAIDTALGREVALKIARPEVVDDAAGLERFKKEARAAATLNHAGIVPVFDCGEVDSFHFYVMPLVDGDHLGNWFVKQSLPLSEQLVAELIRDLAVSLHHGHENGLVHRDVKPPNILMTRDPATERWTPLLLDFGLCGDLDRSMCTTSFLAGTPKYMSPEQAMFGKRRISAASDIYSLGVVLFELLTGTTPHQPVSVPEAVMMLHTRRVTTPRDHRSDLSEDLETICLKCLRTDPDRRYESAKHLADDLTWFLEQRPILARHETGWERIDFEIRYGDWEPRLGWGVIALNVTTFAWAAIGAVVIAWRFPDSQGVTNGMRELATFLAAVAFPLHAGGVYCGWRMVRRAIGYRRLVAFAGLSAIWAVMHWIQFSSDHTLLEIYSEQTFAQVMVFLLISSSFTLQTLMLAFGARAAWCREPTSETEEM